MCPSDCLCLLLVLVFCFMPCDLVVFFLRFPYFLRCPVASVPVSSPKHYMLGWEGARLHSSTFRTEPRIGVWSSGAATL